MFTIEQKQIRKIVEKYLVEQAGLKEDSFELEFVHKSNIDNTEYYSASKVNIDVKMDNPPIEAFMSGPDWSE